jgi:hypothetical protein
MFEKLGKLIKPLLTAVGENGSPSPLRVTESGYLKVKVEKIETIVNSGYTDFTDYNDTPSDYNGDAEKFLSVNSSENGIIFQDITESDISDLEHNAVKIQGKSVNVPSASDHEMVIYYDDTDDTFKYKEVTIPSGTGDMLKEMYDSNYNGIVDEAESVEWTGITNKPSEYNPQDHTHTESEITDLIHNATQLKGKTISEPISGYYLVYQNGIIDWIAAPVGSGTGDMLKDIYDVNSNSIVDKAESVDDGTYSKDAQEISQHIDSTSNPHSVSKSDVGLGSVPNLDTTAAVSKAHDKLHDLNSIDDHNGITGTENNLLSINEFGLPKDSGIAYSGINNAIQKSHDQNTDSGTNKNEFSIGDAANTDKFLTADVGDGSNNPQIRYKADDNKWQYSNNGTLWNDFDPSGTTEVTWSGVLNKPDVFPPEDHTHDDRYYTETETDDLLDNKSDTSHTHSVGDLSDVTLSGLSDNNVLKYDLSTNKFIPSEDLNNDAVWGNITGTLSDQSDLQDELDSKSDTDHTHIEDDITDLTHDAVSIHDKSIDTPTETDNGKYLRYKHLDSKFELVTISGFGGVSYLDEIGDVNVPSPSDGQVLSWSTSNNKWESSDPSSGALDLFSIWLKG